MTVTTTDPRILPVSSAKAELHTFLYDVSKRHDLTLNELMLILTESTHKLYAEAVKKERRPKE